MKTITLGALLAPALGALMCSAHAGGQGTVDANLGAEWVAVGQSRLDRMRGGFDPPSGPPLSFGIERVAYVNGALVASSALKIPDVGRMTAEQAQALDAINRTLVVQVGAGNRFDAPSDRLGGVVIQNTLDGQNIRTLTTLDIGVGTLAAFKDLNAQATLHGALLGAGRP